MSWNGTVRCSYCYKTGHNRRKCDKLTNDTKKRYEQHRAKADELLAMTDEEYKTAESATRYVRSRQDLIDHYVAKANEQRKVYLKRTKIDLATGQKVTNKAAKAERMKKVRCGYCGERGHTRRTCKNVKNDYAVWSERTVEVRKEWYEKLKASGIGIGTMIVKKYRGYNDAGDWGTHKAVALVTSIEFDQVNASGEGYTIICKTNAEIAGRHTGYYGSAIGGLTLRRLLQIIESPADHEDWTVMPSGGVPGAPANWYTEMPGIKEVFSTKDERPYQYRYYANEGWVADIRERLGIEVNAHEA